MCQKNKPYYNYEPIGSLESLSRVVGIDSDMLNINVDDIGSKYRIAGRIQKPDGSVRVVYDASGILKEIHEKIKSRIFQKVIYPRYLQGAIKDKLHPRDYIQDAAFHKGSSLIINEDVKQFFPSIKDTEVLKMWKRLFHFPSDVAECLTKFVTHQGVVPQGAKCSSYIANLIFWDEEYKLYESMQAKGIQYSRFIDDISLSTNRKLTKKNISECISEIYAMFYRKGVTPKRCKHSIKSSGQPMRVHGLNVNSKLSPTINKRKRANIRAAVHECERLFSINGETIKYSNLFNRTRGRVATLDRLHKKEASNLLERLKRVKPL